MRIIISGIILNAFEYLHSDSVWWLKSYLMSFRWSFSNAEFSLPSLPLTPGDSGVRVAHFFAFWVMFCEPLIVVLNCFLFVVLLSVVRFATSDYYVCIVNLILYLTVPIALHSFRVHSCQVKYTKYHLPRKLVKRVFIMCN